MREGWRRVALQDVALVTIGRQRSPEHASGNHMAKYLRAANVKDGRLELSDVHSMNFTPAEQLTYGLERGDVLVTEGCGSIKELGASAPWEGEIEGQVCFQNTLLRLRAKPEAVLPGYLAIWAVHAHHSGAFAAVASGTNIFHIGLRRALGIEFLLPPLDEQRRVVDLLASAGLAIARAQDAVQAITHMHVAVREAALSRATDWITLGEVLSGIEAGRSPDGEDRHPLPGEASVLKVSAVRPG